MLQRLRSGRSPCRLCCEHIWQYCWWASWHGQEPHEESYQQYMRIWRIDGRQTAGSECINTRWLTITSGLTNCVSSKEHIELPTLLHSFACTVFDCDRVYLGYFVMFRAVFNMFVFCIWARRLRSDVSQSKEIVRDCAVFESGVMCCTVFGQWDSALFPSGVQYLSKEVVQYASQVFSTV